MIVHCPTCQSRTEIATTAAMAGGTLAACRACGHEWIEGRALETFEVLQRQAYAEDMARPEQDGEFRRLQSAAKQARSRFRRERRTRRLRSLAWAGLLLAAMSPAAAAIAFPETIVRWAPATIAAYDLMGHSINIYGLEIRNVEVQHLRVDGKTVIAVKGELGNVSMSLRKIPWLRLALHSDKGAEVYHWQLDTGQRPLRPGESTSFVTRIASPPESASGLQIRFARADEIGSNTRP